MKIKSYVDAAKNAWNDSDKLDDVGNSLRLGTFGTGATYAIGAAATQQNYGTISLAFVPAFAWSIGEIAHCRADYLRRRENGTKIPTNRKVGWVCRILFPSLASYSGADGVWDGIDDALIPFSGTFVGYLATMLDDRRGRNKIKRAQDEIAKHEMFPNILSQYVAKNPDVAKRLAKSLTPKDVQNLHGYS